MSAQIIALDVLLYYLHEHSSGSWSQFAKAVRSFNPDADEFSIARGLSEHGLVEFLWDGKRGWSVTSATAVVSNRAGGRISLWGGTHRAALHLVQAGVACHIDERRIIRSEATYTYRHAVAIDTPNASALRGIVPIANSRDIVQNLPALEAILLKLPACDAPSLSASTYRCVYHRFGVIANDEPSPFLPESPSLWRVGRNRYIFVRHGVVRQVPEWLGKWLLYACEREETYAAMYVREGQVLTLPFAPMIPPPFARALLVSGAAEIMPSQFGTRCFANVEESLARDVCAKLQIEAEIVERRPRDVA